MSPLPTTEEMIANSAANMARRIGRPRVPDEDKAKPVGISLSVRTTNDLRTLTSVTGKSRSEIIADAVLFWGHVLRNTDNPDKGGYSVSEAILEFPYAGSPTEMLPPLTENELTVASALASHALAAWISRGDRRRDEIPSAMESFFSAAVKTVRGSR